MKTLHREEVTKLWDKFWSEMSQEWFKAEVLQDYTGEDDSPSLRAWYSGDKKTALELLRTDDDEDFTNDCRAKLAQGVKLLRLHVIDEPLSPYMQWEIEYYRKISQPLRGEQIFIVQKSKLGDIELPLGDFMIYDNRRAIVNSYSQNGLMIQADFYDEPDNISHFIWLKNELKKQAVPLQKFIG